MGGNAVEWYADWKNVVYANSMQCCNLFIFPHVSLNNGLFLSLATKADLHPCWLLYGYEEFHPHDEAAACQDRTCCQVCTCSQAFPCHQGGVCNRQVC